MKPVKKHVRRSAVGMALAMLLLAASLVVGGCREKAANATEPPAAKVEGDKVSFAQDAPQLGNISAAPAELRQSSEMGVYGRLVWNEDVTGRVFSPIMGRVTKINVDIGDTVAAGDVLALLASPDFGQSQADVKKAASDLALADRTLTRLRDLLAHGAAAQKDVDAAQSDYEKAAAEHQRAVAQARNLAQGAGGNAVDGAYPLRSPVAGMVVEKNLTPGQQVRPDMQLANMPQFTNPQFVVTDPTRLWLLLDATELQAVTLKAGQAVRLVAKAYPNRTFVGRIEMVGQSLDPATRTVKVRAAVENPDRLLKAEMYVTAEVADGVATGVAVPAKAVFMRGNQYYLFVEDAPGRFERRAVKLGLENGGAIAVEDGVAPGQRVVVEGALLLQAIIEKGENP